MAITSSGHDLRSERISKNVLIRFKIFSWDGCHLRRMVPLLIRTHHRASELWQNRDFVTRKAFTRLAAEVGGEIELLVYLDAADRGGRKTRRLKGLDKEARWLFRKFKELRVDKETIKPLVMGRDLIKMGLAPGPDMGRVLKKLYNMQLDNKFETKSRALEAARRILEGDQA